MYMKFKVDVTNYKDIIGNYCGCGWENNFTEYKKEIKEKLDSCINYQKNYIDGNKLEEILFEEIEADVFISHSHIDKNLAIAISGWLYKEMGLTAFVDSCVWDYVDEYLDELNNRYNIIKREYKHQTYGYRKANYFASHLYLMLNSALNHMLDKTECLWFINTENSVIPLDKIGKPDQTISPWIYSEIVMANTLRKKIPERYGYEKRSLEHASELNENVLFTHQIELENFIEIDSSIFFEWEKNKNSEEHALDTLYRITKKEEKFYE